MDKDPISNRTHYNPVTVTVDDTVGAALLGIVALVLTIALLRSEARYRRLLRQINSRSEDVEPAGVEQP